MSAPFSVYDDNLFDARAADALEAVISAERKRLTIALLIANGATRYAFPHHNADDAIQAAVGAVTEARFRMDRMIASRGLGEPCRAAPTTGTQCLALQNRVTINEAGANIHPFGPVLTAAARVDEAERGLILAAHGAGGKVPTPDSFQSGFHSPMAG